MGKRMPQANLYFKKYSDSELISRAQQVHDLMDENVLIFPTPPVDLEDLQILITDYTFASAAAIKGSKPDTVQKNSTKLSLQLALKTLAIYVTNIARGSISDTPQGDLIARNTISKSGFLISYDPRPVDHISGIPAPKIVRAISEEIGSLKILIRQYKNANRNTLSYSVNYRLSAVPGSPAGEWVTKNFTGQNQIVLTGLESGKSYDWKIAAIGGRNTMRNIQKPVNFSSVFTNVIL